VLRKTLLLGAVASLLLLTQPSYAGMGPSSAGPGHSADVAEPMRRTAAAYAAERAHSCRTPTGARLSTTDPNCRPR
jgi:hypothetical protein